MQKLPSNQVIYHEISGAGDRTVVLIHGLASSQNEWKFVAPQLQSAGYRILKLDLLGHGYSYHPPGRCAYSAVSAYQALEDLLCSFNFDTPVALVGHSFGAHLAMRFTLSHPDQVHALVLIDPYLCFDQLLPPARLIFAWPALPAFFYSRLPRPLLWASLWLDNLRLGPVNPHLALPLNEITSMVDDYLRCSPNVVYFLRSAADLSRQSPALKPPVRLIWGKRDRTLSTRSFKEFAAKLAGCTSKTVDAGHYPHQTNPQEVSAFILEFLAQ